MTNIVMITRGRAKLTAQTLNSLFTHTPNDAYNLTIIDDDSSGELSVSSPFPSVALLRNCASKGIVGQVRNLGIYWSERFFGRGEWLYLSDNDVYFLPGWLDSLISIGTWLPNNSVVGGQQHPFHGTSVDMYRFHETDAVAGYSQLMRWETWDRYGPFDAHSPGVCQSEDFAFCQSVIKDGGKVGYIHPRVILHCGLTNSHGKPAIGSDQFERVEGVYYE